MPRSWSARRGPSRARWAIDPMEARCLLTAARESGSARTVGVSEEELVSSDIVGDSHEFGVAVAGRLFPEDYR